MALGPKRGSPVPLIIFIVLFVFAAVGLVLVAVELGKARETIAKQKGELSASRRKYQEKAETLADLQEWVGVKHADPKKQKPEIAKLIQRMRDAEESRGNLTLVELLYTVEQEKLRLAAELEQVKAAARKTEEDLQAALAREQAKVQSKEALIAKRDQKIDELTQELSNQIAKARKNLNDARAKHLATQKSLSAQVEQLGQTLRKKEDYIRELLQLIAGLKGQQEKVQGTATTFKPDREAPDGRVLLVDDEAGVVVDIGRKKGVRRGLKFDVYTEKADGTRVLKGKIEIKTVFPEISRAILLDAGDQRVVDVIHKGDILINVAFDPGRARVFVADRVFDDAKKRSIRDRLKEYGAVLEDEVTLRTDYLIVSPKSHGGKFIERAKQMNIPMIRESDLRAFLSR